MLKPVMMRILDQKVVLFNKLGLKILKTFIKLFRKTINKFWIEPLEDFLLVSVTLKDRGQFHELFINIMIWLKDLGELIKSLGIIKVKKLEGEQWVIIYIGNNYAYSDITLCRTFFPSPVKVNQVKWIFLWQLKSVLPQFIDQADMVICDVNRHINYHSLNVKHIFRVPPLIRQRLVIDRPIDKIISRMNVQNVKKILKEGFTYEVSRNISDLELFYYKMYLPLISYRHGDEAVPIDFKTQKKLMRKGELLILKLNNEKVGGLLGHGIGGVYFLKSVGIDKQHLDLFERNALGALYWFAIEQANKNGFKYVDFGLSRCLLHDGVFWAKFLWGTKVQRNFSDHSSNYLLFIPNRLNDSFRKFLNESGFIAEDSDKFRLVLFKKDKESNLGYSEKELSRLKNISERLGLAEFLILPQ